MNRLVIGHMPYPYRAMLAVCSDLDETPGRQAYHESARFLNSTGTSKMGTGLGLEIGNTLYFDMPNEQFAYWNADDAGREMVRNLIRSGHIDCFHSFGDLATSRAHASRALEELDRYGCRIKVWVDHGTAATNFGADIMRGTGDLPGAPAYHADLTLAHGVEYVWRGRVTSIVGQDVRRRWSGVWDARHPLKSTETLAKEAAKAALGKMGQAKFAMHGSNDLLRPITLRDGRSVTEFMRCNPHWGGVSSCDTAMGIPEVLTDRYLGQLVERGGTCILYTHLGKIQNSDEPFNAATRDAFRRLADCYHRGDILVATTRRVLDYTRMRQTVTVRLERKATHAIVHVTRPSPDTDLSGLTLRVSGADSLELLVDGTDPQAVLRNPARRGDICVSIPWNRLSFPES